MLDLATIETLSLHLGKAQFLDNLFAAWQRNEGTAADAVRIAKVALDETESQVANLTLWAARTPPDSPAGAALQQQLDHVSELLPGLRRHYADAQTALEQVHANTALADELADWFAGWLSGFWGLPVERQRQFLTAIGATVRVWREDDPDRAGLPRAELRIALPTDAKLLPPLSEDHVDTTLDCWHVPLDLEAGVELAHIHRECASDEWQLPPRHTQAEERQHRAWSARKIMATALWEMREQGLRPPKVPL